jgi:hypothetical protein
MCVPLCSAVTATLMSVGCRIVQKYVGKCEGSAWRNNILPLRFKSRFAISNDMTSLNFLLLILTTYEQNVLHIKYQHFFYKTSAPAMGPTKPPIEWVPMFFTGGKAIGTHLHLLSGLK